MLEHLFGVPFNLASFVVCLSVVVFVHEFGHFLIARRNGVKCESFSIGFGPELFGRTDKHGTRWKVSLVPLGGYVRMFGESESMHVVEGGADGTESEEQRSMTAEEWAHSLKSKTVAQRAAIVFAGPAANFVFAIIVLTCIFMTYGRPVIDPVIGAVNEDSAAAAAGLQPGDRIVDIDGTAITRFEDIQRLVQLGYGETMQVTVNRDGANMQLSVTPRIVERPDAFGNVQKTALLGISAGEARTMEHLGPSGAVVAAVRQTYEVVEATGVAVGQMISGRRGTEDLGGPIRIYKYSGQAAKTGFAGFVLFMAILSINLGLINLVPVPLLDGGHLLFYAIEAVRGRPLSDRAQEWGFRIGLALVGALMVFVTWNDIVQTWLRGPSASG